MLKNREKEFRKIFTGKMYQGNSYSFDERLNAIGVLLTDLYAELELLKRRSDE